MMVLRVAMISFHSCPALAPGSGKVGGMNVYIIELAKELSLLGLEIDIFTRNHLESDRDVSFLAPNVRIVHLDGGPIDAEMDAFTGYIHGFYNEVLGYQYEHRIAYHLVHSHYWMSGLIGQEFSIKNDIPHVLNFHTLEHLKRKAIGPEDPFNDRERIEIDLIGSADLIVTSSEHERQAIINLRRSSGGKIVVIPCGVNLSTFRPIKRQVARDRLGICDDKIILFVGRLEPLKGIDFLFKVVEALGADRRFKLFVVGGMSENDPEVLRLKALSEKMGLSATVVFVNRVDRQELATYFSAADVCLVPSYYESFGLVALESMACGTPVIASRVGGLPSLIKHGKTGFLMPWRCPDSYADRLMMIFQNSQLSESMRNASIRYATSLAWPRVAPLVLSAYESLVPTRKS